ncbi:MAG: hypothetical protein ABI462_14320 [Ignavibacteria bacterium]
MKTLTSITLVTLLSINFIFFACGEKKENTQTKKDDKTTTQTQTPQQTQTTVTAPKIGKVWESIQKKTDELNKTIESKKLAGVHEIAFSIRDLVKSLPGQSSGLGTDKVEMLKTHVSEIEKSAELLDKYGDANDYKNTKANYEIFIKHLDMIKSMYPSDSFM